MRVIIVGAGGHGQVVADILHAMGDGVAASAIGYVDDNAGLHDAVLLNLPVLGSVDDLVSHPHDAIIVAIGDNVVRHRVVDKLAQAGERFATAHHPSAVIARHVTIGDGAMISAGVVVNPGTQVGDHVILNTGCTVDHHNCIGDYVHVAPGVHLGGEVRIGAGALIGIAATVLPGCSVGEWARVGAGAVVTRDIPAGVTAAGAPARIRRQIAGV